MAEQTSTRPVDCASDVASCVNQARALAHSAIDAMGGVGTLLGAASKCVADAMEQRQAAPHTADDAIRMPAAVDHVIHERRNRLHQVRAVVAGAFAMAEANDDSSDVRWALEAALDQFQDAIDSLEPLDICRDAQEASHG